MPVIKFIRSGRFLSVLFLLTLVAELLMLNRWLGKPNLTASPMIWLVLGIMNAWAGSVLMARFHTGIGESGTRPARWFAARMLVAVAAFTAGVLYAVYLLKGVYLEIPEINTASDILPGKREFIRRFLNGETVYVPVQFDSYALQPTFLPFRWLPFVIAELLKFDYRWIPFGGFALGISFWVFSNKVVHEKANYLEIIVKAFFPFAALGVFIIHEKMDFALAVELLILGYHLILARFIFNKNPWIVAVSLILCLLSRYSILLWLAVPACWLIMEKRYAFLGKIIFITLAGIFLFYWLPFCRHDMGKHFLEASKYYVDACYGCWKTDSWLPAGAIPNFLSKGAGFQYLSYAYGPKDLEARYQLNTNLGIITCIASILISCFALYKHIKTKNNPKVIQGYILASLKVYMTLFIGFILCPFSYLFIVPFFMSFPLFYSISFKSAFADWK